MDDISISIKYKVLNATITFFQNEQLLKRGDWKLKTSYLINLIVWDVFWLLGLSEDFGDGGGERRLAVVDVADGADVDVRLRRIVGGVLIVAKNNLLVSFSTFFAQEWAGLGLIVQ